MAEMSYKIDYEKWANDVLDGFQYRGKSIRQWADLIASDVYIDRIEVMAYITQKMAKISREILYAEPFPADYVEKSTALDTYQELLDYLKGADEDEEERTNNNSNSKTPGETARDY